VGGGIVKMPDRIDWYYRDFNSAAEVKALSQADRDVYRSLLELVWEHGGFVPLERTRCASLLPFRDQAISDQVWNLLSKHEGRGMTHPKMLRLVQRYNRLRKAGAAGGIASGRSRREARGKATGKATGEAVDEGASSSPLLLSSSPHVSRERDEADGEAPLASIAAPRGAARQGPRPGETFPEMGRRHEREAEERREAAMRQRQAEERAERLAAVPDPVPTPEAERLAAEVRARLRTLSRREA
jgi:hypothetical protein